MLSYTFQIYFDFSGYCDMAVGIGKMFHIELPVNFDSPYKSYSIIEFWKRWHMTWSKLDIYSMGNPARFGTGSQSIVQKGMGQMQSCISMVMYFCVCECNVADIPRR